MINAYIITKFFADILILRNKKKRMNYIFVILYNILICDRSSAEVTKNVLGITFFSVM